MSKELQYQNNVQNFFMSRKHGTWELLNDVDAISIINKQTYVSGYTHTELVLSPNTTPG